MLNIVPRSDSYYEGWMKLSNILAIRQLKKDMNFIVLKDVTISIEPGFHFIFHSIDTINLKVRMTKTVGLSYGTNNTYHYRGFIRKLIRRIMWAGSKSYWPYYVDHMIRAICNGINFFNVPLIYFSQKLFQMENEQQAVNSELAGFDKHKLKAVTTNEKNPLPTKETIEQEKSSSP